MAFPVSNLPSASLPWGREVEKQISTLVTSSAANEVNNTARDNQLAASYNRLDAAVIGLVASDIRIDGAVADAAAAAADAADAAATANTAINAITGLGTPGSSTTVNASNIIGGTLKTATSGRHTEITSTQINFYDGSGNYSGKISAAADGRSSTVEVTTTTGSGIIAYNGGVDINGPGTNISSGNNGNGSILLLASAGVDVSGAFRTTSTANISGTLTTPGGTWSSGSLINNGGYMQCPDTRSRSTTGGLAMFVASNGTYHVGSSSRRYKTDIENYEVNVSALLSMQPITFRYKSEVKEVGDAAGYTTGFIAEDFDEAGLTEYVVYSEDENGAMVPEGIQYEKLCVGLHTVAVQQQQTIESLISRIEALEAKVQ
jgi:hypothetical protein